MPCRMAIILARPDQCSSGAKSSEQIHHLSPPGRWPPMIPFHRGLALAAPAARRC